MNLKHVKCFNCHEKGELSKLCPEPKSARRTLVVESEPEKQSVKSEQEDGAEKDQ